MGVRPYSPSIGSFNAEDPVLGHVGIGITTNRYPYAWDNPLNLYDLDGRDVLLGMPICILACSPEAQKEISDRATDLVKEINFSTEEFIVAIAGSMGGAGICGIAAIGASAVGTPAAGAAAGTLCVTVETIGTVETVNDIFDDENGLPTDEFFK